MAPEQTNIPLALRLIACGLPVPTFTPGKDGGCASWITSGKGDDSRHWEVELATGDTCRPFGTDPAAGLLFRCVTTDDGPRLLPDTADPLLLGWLIAEIERLTGGTIGIDGPVLSGEWIIWSPDGLVLGDGMSRLEALTAAWESAKAAE